MTIFHTKVDDVKLIAIAIANCNLENGDLVFGIYLCGHYMYNIIAL